MPYSCMVSIQMFSIVCFQPVRSNHKYNTRLASKEGYYVSKVRTNYGKFNIRYIGAKNTSSQKTFSQKKETSIRNNVKISSYTHAEMHDALLLLLSYRPCMCCTFSVFIIC